MMQKRYWLVFLVLTALLAPHCDPTTGNEPPQEQVIKTDGVQEPSQNEPATQRDGSSEAKTPDLPTPRDEPATEPGPRETVPALDVVSPEPVPETVAETTPDASPEPAVETTPELPPEPTPEPPQDKAPQGKDVWVAVGYGGRRMRSLDGGKTWQDIIETKANGGDDRELLRCVTFGKGYFVAMGWKGWRSTDGKTWKEFDVQGNWRGGIAYGNGMFVAVGGVGRVTTSTDALTWVGAKVTSGHLRNVAYGGGMWVAIGDGARRISTKDGKTWFGDTTGGDNLRGIGYGAGYFVAVGDNGRIIRTNDGKTWQDVSISQKIAFRSVVWIGNAFMAFGSSSKVYRSTDGKSWTPLTPPKSTPAGVFWQGNVFLASSWPGNVFRSTDGLSWTQTYKDTDNSITSIAHGVIP